MKYQKILTELCQGSGAILLKYFEKTHKIEKKRGAGIVTEADKASEAYLMKNIFRSFPNSSIITEESGEFKNSGEMTWILDPLDGTTNYAHGFPWFCVSVGLHVNGKAAAGGILNPVTKEFFFAEKGKGTFKNGKRLRVSKVKNIADSLLGTGFYYSKDRELKEEMEIFTAMNQYALGVRRPGSAALDLAYVASGRYDGFWERRLSSWDVAAGILMVEEAGGKVSGYGGQPTDIFAGELVASNGHLHRRIVSIIGKALKG